MLTRKQHELLLYINRHLTEKGVSPSFDEMKEALGLKSKSGIHRLITGLEERGFIKRLAHKARALEVIRLPEDLGIGGRKGEGGARFSPNVIQGNFGGAITGATVATEVAAVQLPLYGRIAAGTPIEALRDHTNTIDVPGSLLGRGEHYALEVEGDSMINAGIFNGDTAIIERCDTADNGSVVVGLVDNGEGTLQRLGRKGDWVGLGAANRGLESGS